MPPSSARAPRWPRLLPLLGIALLLAAMARFWPYVNDDAYITFRYSRALAEGRGPWFNPGEHVEGYTNPLWMLLLAGLFPLVGADALPTVAKALGAASVALAVWSAASLARRERRGEALGGGILGLGVAALAAGAPGLAVNAVSGLETGLYALLLTLGGAALVGELAGERSGRGAAWLALAGWTRPEGWLLACLGLGTKLALLLRLGARAQVRSGVGELLAVLGALGAQLALRALLYDGELLPNTWYAKQGGFAGVGAPTYTWEGLAGPLLGIPGVILLIPGLALLLRRRPALAPAAVIALGAALLPVLTGADWMIGHRMVAPALPLLLGVAALAWTGLLEGRLPEPLGAAPLLLVAAIAAGIQAVEADDLADEVALRAQGYQTGHEALAAFLAARSAPGDGVALMDIGIVGYRDPGLRILDLSGLTDRFIARSPGPFLDKRYDLSYVLDQAPRWIVIALYLPGRAYEKPPPGRPIKPWTTIEDRLISDPRFQARYEHPGALVRRGTWTDGVAAHLGAVAAFEHAHPALQYLLVLFERG